MRKPPAPVVVDVPAVRDRREKRVDAVVVVTTSPELQRERVLARGTMMPRTGSIIARRTRRMRKSAARISSWIPRTVSIRARANQAFWPRSLRCRGGEPGRRFLSLIDRAKSSSIPKPRP
jgi:hypothetical protein